MKAMILAAGLGKRMRPLTDSTPKPLLLAAGKPLIEYHIDRLRDAGITEFMVNLAYQGEKIRRYLGDGHAWGVEISYSEEPFPLETGGALAAALDWLGEAPFVLVNGDVWTDYPFARFLQHPLSESVQGRLVLVDNPDFNAVGDFTLDRQGDDGECLLRTIDEAGEDCPSYTFSGLSLLRPSLIAEYPQRRQKFPLREVFDRAIAGGQLSAEVFSGSWSDIGTPERLTDLNAAILMAALE